MPGRQHLSIGGTILLGIVGSFIGGFLGYLLFHKDGQDGFFQPSGLFGSVVGAVIALLIWERMGSQPQVVGIPLTTDRPKSGGRLRTEAATGLFHGRASAV